MAKRKVIKTVFRKATGLPDEEVALRLVRLYLGEVARPKLKRTVDLDAVLNAYFYALRRVGNKEKELKAIEKIVEEEEKEIASESKQQLIPMPSEGK